MSMDPTVGDFAQADVLVEGKKIVAVGRNLHAGGAAVIDARGRIVMPGFIDTHHHQFETALRSFLADGLLFDDGSAARARSNYFEYILLTFAPVYRPQDVYINELFGGAEPARRRRDDGARHLADPSLARALATPRSRRCRDSGRRAVFGYFESAGAASARPGNQYPDDARRIKNAVVLVERPARHHDHGRRDLPAGLRDGLADRARARPSGRGAHPLAFGMRPTFDALAQGTGGDGAARFGPDNLFIHMTGMSDLGWQKARDAGAQRLARGADRDEHAPRHAADPEDAEPGHRAVARTDVECTLTADFFTQMRTAMSAAAHAREPDVLDAGLRSANRRPTPATGLPPLADHARRAALRDDQRREGLQLDSKIGSLTPGKEADIIILDAEAINVAPLNHVPGAVVSLMERTNVETVIVAGKVRKWKGRLLDVNLASLRTRARGLARLPVRHRGRAEGPVPQAACDARPRRRRSAQAMTRAVDDGPELPIKLDTTSNGEFAPVPLDAAALPRARAGARGRRRRRRDGSASRRRATWSRCSARRRRSARSTAPSPPPASAAAATRCRTRRRSSSPPRRRRSAATSSSSTCSCTT